MPEDLKNYGAARARAGVAAGASGVRAARAGRRGRTTRDDDARGDDVRGKRGGNGARRGFAAAYATRAGISLAAHVVQDAQARGGEEVLGFGVTWWGRRR